eukprot:scaffold4145_cov165-Skeletonema_dohrnii-CCMP3373.AAC.1
MSSTVRTHASPYPSSSAAHTMPLQLEPHLLRGPVAVAVSDNYIDFDNCCKGIGTGAAYQIAARDPNCGDMTASKHVASSSCGMDCNKVATAICKGYMDQAMKDTCPHVGFNAGGYLDYDIWSGLTGQCYGTVKDLLTLNNNAN